MKRWNGWGDENVQYPLPVSARVYLESRLGVGQSIPDASLETTLAQIPPSGLPEHPLISTLPTDRLLHARGQSLPDWIALRSGCIGQFPDGVAFPENDEQVRSLLEFASKNQVRLIPYGGGTSVVGHINPLPGQQPILTVDMGRMDQLLELDETSRLATFRAGIPGPQIEAQLNQKGLTLGHFPQSFEYSTLGGWIATRSSGQQSCRYGRIEGLFAGGKMQSFQGELTIPSLPASAAGPDIRHMLLGSEGRLGIITSATVRLRQLPEVDQFYAAFFHNWQEGTEAVRAIIQQGVAVSMLRLSNASETEITLALSGKEKLVSWADKGLRLVKFDQHRCLLIYALTGSRSSTRQAKHAAEQLIRRHGGLPTGELIGRMWKKSRFTSPYLRNALWEQGYALDTLETALPWSALPACAGQVLPALQHGLAGLDERVLAFAHLSHVYNDGVSLYITYLFRRVKDPQEMLERWKKLKFSASQLIIAHGGTISHQHGVGFDHADWMLAEKSPAGMHMLANLCHTFDPQGLLNPGKLLPGDNNQ